LAKHRGRSEIDNPKAGDCSNIDEQVCLGDALEACFGRTGTPKSRLPGESLAGKALSVTLRRIIFWLHLAVGLTVGLVVVFLAVTGSILAFQSQITAWAERNARVVTSAPVSICISPAALLARASIDQQRPPTSLTLFADPHRPAEVVFGRDTLLVNPCSGDIIRRDAGRLRAFFFFDRS
jgi:hypothetical protein